jgi:hypothetical protein
VNHANPLALILNHFITDYSTQRVRLEDLRVHATHADPSLRGDPRARSRILAALTDLETEGLIAFPRSLKNFDDRSQPALPLWVTKPPRDRRRPPTAPRRVWPPALERAAVLADRPDEVAMLNLIADWLRDNSHAEPVPIEERSLELLDDEKALTLQTGKRLFTTGVLTLDLLRCYRTPLPFVSQHVQGIGPTCLLVAENNATYHSLLTSARELSQSTRPDLHVAWGSGRQFPVAIDSVRLLAPMPVSLHYFGDLDHAGFQIAIDAARAAVQQGLPILRPATALYEAALDYGTPRVDKSNFGSRLDYSDLLEWLPERLRPRVATLLHGRMRIPQETVGRRLLRENSARLLWIDTPPD